MSLRPLHLAVACLVCALPAAAQTLPPLRGLGLNEGASLSELVRAGLMSVDASQYEAAKASGMSGSVALRIVVPPRGNQFISMVKTTSLASVIEYAELLFAAAFWVLVVITTLSFDQAGFAPLSMSQPVVTAPKIGKSFGPVQVLADVMLDVRTRDFVAAVLT